MKNGIENGYYHEINPAGFGVAIKAGQGFLVIPEEHVPEFKQMLVAFYEGENIEVIRKFLKEKCWKTF